MNLYEVTYTMLPVESPSNQIFFEREIVTASSPEAAIALPQVQAKLKRYRETTQRGPRCPIYAYAYKFEGPSAN